MTPRAELLNELTERIRQGLPVSFTKCGDGEAAAMSGEVGENCDGHPYSLELGAALRKAFAFLGTLPDIHVIQWNDQERYQALLHHEGQEDIGQTKRFWLTVRDCTRPKVFVGPERLGGAAALLKAEHVVIPLVNAFGSYTQIRHALTMEMKVEPGTIFVFCAGMPSKSWIAEVLNAYPSASCIDAGSAFDPIFVGNTRTGQLSREQVWELYSDVLPPLVHSVIFSKNRAMQLDALLRSMRRYAPGFWPPTIFFMTTDSGADETYQHIMSEYPDCGWFRQLRKPITDDLLTCMETTRQYGALFSDDDVFFRPVPRFEIGAGESFSVRFGSATFVEQCGPQPCLGWSGDGNVHPINEMRAAIRTASPHDPNGFEPVMNHPTLAVKEKRAALQSLVSIPHNLVQDVFPNPNMGGSAAELTGRYLAGQRIDLDAMDFSEVKTSHAFMEYRYRRVS